MTLRRMKMTVEATNHEGFDLPERSNMTKAW